MEEKQVNKKSKKIKVGIAVSTIAMAILGFQVYASTNGYGNVFFMLKELVTTKDVQGEENIFSDKELTLSYKSIEIAKGLKMQVNRLELKDNESSIYLFITNEKENNELLPLHYIVRVDKPYDGGYIPVFRPESSNKTFDGNKGTLGQYKDIINVPCKLEGNEKISIVVQDKDKNTLKSIEIDLDTREITITGEEDVSKISQIELKKYLGIFSQLNNDAHEDVQIVRMAYDIYEMNNPDDKYSTLEKINQTIREYYGDKVEFQTVEPAPDTRGGTLESIVTHTGSYVYPSYQADGYITDIDIKNYKKGICLKIEDIDYKDGIYTVKYIYTLASETEIDNEKVEELPQYEATIQLKRNDDALYSKYQIVELSKEKEVKEKVSTEINDNTIDNDKEEKIDEKTDKKTDEKVDKKEETTNTNKDNINNNNDKTDKTDKTKEVKDDMQEIKVEKPEYNPDEIDNYSSSIDWIEYWAPGIKFQYPSDWDFSDIPRLTGRQLTVNADAHGWAFGKNLDTQEIVESYMTIEVYDQVDFYAVDEENAFLKFAGQYGLKDVDSYENPYIGGNGLKWYSLYDVNAKDTASDIYFVNFQPFAKREGETQTRYIVNIIRITTSEAANLKVPSIQNYILGEAKLTSK